jgi:predicted nucleic-acid-binding protein
VLAADTNVLVRLLVGDDLSQQEAVLRRLRRARSQGVGVLVTDVVLAELAWVLDAAYGYGRVEIAAAIRGILATPPFVVSDRVTVLGALASYEGGPADFADYLILETSRRGGVTKLLTFDRALRKHPDCEPP